jgi:hypothetical protein
VDVTPTLVTRHVRVSGACEEALGGHTGGCSSRSLGSARRAGLVPRPYASTWTSRSACGGRSTSDLFAVGWSPPTPTRVRRSQRNVEVGMASPGVTRRAGSADARPRLPPRTWAANSSGDDRCQRLQVGRQLRQRRSRVPRASRSCCSSHTHTAPSATPEGFEH